MLFLLIHGLGSKLLAHPERTGATLG
jgi:hypothetical protein